MPPRSWEPPQMLKTLEVNGYEMAYLERGQGTPLILVHGSLDDYRAWSLQMERFSAGYRTIAVSLRHAYPEHWDGHGDRFSISQHADDLSAFIQALNAGPVHLVGHSRGGDIALILAAKYPQRVRSLVLADPAPLDEILPKTPGVRAETENRKAFVTEALRRMQQGDVNSGLEIFTDAVSAPGNWQKLPEAAKQRRRDNAWSLKSLTTDAKTPFNRTDARKIDVPILLVTGDQSPRLYGMMHAALQPWLKHHHRVTISNASHPMNSENPDAFNTAVLAFLEER